MIKGGLELRVARPVAFLLRAERCQGSSKSRSWSRSVGDEAMVASSFTVNDGAATVRSAPVLRFRNVLIVTGVVLSGIAGNAQRAAYAQGLTIERPVFGASRGLRTVSPPLALDDPGNAKARVHRDPYGKPCVGVFGLSRPQVVNTKMFDQTVIADNHCSALIKLKVCYFGSQTCLPVEVPPYGRKETLLGFFPAMKEFRYQYTEQF
jgi:hypothetical protein